MEEEMKIEEMEMEMIKKIFIKFSKDKFTRRLL